MGRVAVVNEPAAIRRVLMTNTENYQKDWLQRRVLSAALANGLLTVESDQWKFADQTKNRSESPIKTGTSEKPLNR
jgi:hypothetical protein